MSRHARGGPQREPDWSALPSAVSPALRSVCAAVLQRTHGSACATSATCAWRWTARSTPAPDRAGRAGSRSRAAPALEARPSCGRRRRRGRDGRRRCVELRPSPPAVAVTRFALALAEGQQFQNTGRQAVADLPGRHAARLRGRPTIVPAVDVGPRGEAHPGHPTVTAAVGRIRCFHRMASPSPFVLVSTERSRGLPSAAERRSRSVPSALCRDELGRRRDRVRQGSKGIMRVSANGGQPEVLVSVKDGELAHGPQVLPGGRMVLFTLATAPAPTAGTRRRSSCSR